MGLLTTDRAEYVFVAPGKFIRAASGEKFMWPTHIRLTKWVTVPYYAPKIHDVIATRMGVLRRDGHVCGYCGDTATTWDHIMPQGRGGENTWNNTIAACQPCNSRKGMRTPEEAGMTLLWNPKNPSKSSYNYDKEQKKIWKMMEEGKLIMPDNFDNDDALEGELDHED